MDIQGNYPDANEGGEEVYVNINEMRDVSLPAPDYLADDALASSNSQKISSKPEEDTGTTHLPRDRDLTVEPEVVGEELYLPREALIKEKNRITVTDDDLLKDSYWYQPGLPRYASTVY